LQSREIEGAMLIAYVGDGQLSAINGSAAGVIPPVSWASHT